MRTLPLLIVYHLNVYTIVFEERVSVCIVFLVNRHTRGRVHVYSITKYNGDPLQSDRREKWIKHDHLL